jgi:integrase
VLDRFAAFLAGRGLNRASDQVCLDFIASQTGTRLGALREPVRDKDVQAVRRPVVLMAEALAGRAVVIDRSVIPAKDGCPARFRLLRDDYVGWCRARGNAEATVATKDKAVSRFLGYLDEAGAGDLAALGVRDVSGFLLRHRGLRRKTIAGMRSSLADFLAFLAATGRTPQSLAGRLPPHRHLRHESEPHLWTAEEIRRLLAVIDRQSAAGKRDYAMILMTARLGLRISDLRQLELGDLDWRAKTITIVQHKTGRPLSLPLLDGRRLGDHRLRPARPPRNRLREGVRQAPPSLRRVRLLLVGRLPAAALRCPREDRVPARPGVRDAFPARRAGRGHDRQWRADAGDISRAGTRLQRHDPGLLPPLRRRTAAMLRAGRRRRHRPGGAG